MNPLWPTLIALGSLAVAALTVIVTYLNAGRQARAAFDLEHAKWLWEKKDKAYGGLLSTLASRDWWNQPMSHEQRRMESAEASDLAVRYASDDVLAQAEILYREAKEWSPGQIATPESKDAVPSLIQAIRAELAGKREMERTMDRHIREFKKSLRSSSGEN
jgi:hypothetical protein